MGKAILIVVAALSLVGASGCGALSPSEEGGAASTSEPTSQRSTDVVPTTEAGASPTEVSAASASTVESDGEFADALEAAKAAEESSTTAASTTIVDSDQDATTSVVGVLVQPGDSGAFTSPSGNIACVLSAAYGASCWIGEKQWTIPQPDDPDCAELDYGNAVDVTVDGISWPCYSDFYWEREAEPLPYGDSMQVGDITCSSARNGVSCKNNDGQGFRVARAEVVVF